MSIRMLMWILLMGATCANAAAPKKPAAPPAAPVSASPAAEDIDVDALARAKDVNANAVGANNETSGNDPAPAAESASEPAPSMPAATADQAAPASVPDLPSAAPLPAAPPDTRLSAACEARATRLLDAAQKGDYEGATRDFDANVRSAMPVAKFKQAWESLSQFGALQARGQYHLSKGGEYIAVTIPLIFAKANLYAQIACGNDGKIAGFNIKPLETPQP